MAFYKASMLFWARVICVPMFNDPGSSPVAQLVYIRYIPIHEQGPQQVNCNALKCVFFLLFVFPKPVKYKSYPTANFIGKLNHTATCHEEFRILKHHGWIRLQQMIIPSIRMCAPMQYLSLRN